MAIFIWIMVRRRVRFMCFSKAISSMFEAMSGNGPKRQPIRLMALMYTPFMMTLPRLHLTGAII